MKCLKRNTRTFEYRAYHGVEEILNDGMHTGEYEIVYEDPVRFSGNISPASGYIAQKLFGIDNDCTHIIVVASPNTGIKTSGIIDWNGYEHSILEVRESLNNTSIAIKRLKGDTTGSDSL